jgi:hypothetical protein
MKFFIMLLLVFGPTIASAERMVRFLFNSTQNCTAEDDLKIDAIFNITVRRRQLRMSSINTPRELWASYCKDNCAGYVAGTCRATGCVGYRRRTSVGGDNERELQVSCADQVQAMNNQMNLFVTNNAVSSSCKAYLNPSLRSSECYDDVIYGEIENIRLWNMSASTQTLITDNMQNGQPICKNLNFNIEAKVNPCVDLVLFRTISPTGVVIRENTDYDVPYSAFGKTTAGTTMMKAKMSSVGIHTLIIAPDGIESKKRILQFNVTNC